MRDELATVLRLVAEGKLSADEAAPLIEALSRAPAGSTRSGLQPDRRPEPGVDAPTGAEAPIRDSRALRIRVLEKGRQVVNLRIPIPFAGSALRWVPGLSTDQRDQIRAAIAGGSRGPILDVEDEDGGVVISVE